MYIAIEGIKGSGKSTVIGQLQQCARRSGILFTVFPITAPINYPNNYESYYRSSPELRNNDFFVEHLFIERARWHQSRISQSGELILGDRCLLTSYVTRWTKWDDPYYTIKRVETFQKEIAKPKVIIWLKSDPVQSYKRILSRNKVSVRSSDEKLVRLKESAEVYEELLGGKLYLKKISSAQILQLDANNKPEDIKNEIISILKFYNN